MALLCLQAFAQVRGTSETVTKPLPFSHNFQNVTLDPTPVIGAPSRVQYVQTFTAGTNPSLGLNSVLSLIGGDVSIPGWLNDLSSGVSFFCSGVAPRFSINGSVDVGGYYQIHSVGNSDININYPVQVNVDYPAANTFACGETIRINTNYTVLDPGGTKLQVKPPFVNQELGPTIDNLRFSASIGLEAWVGYGVEFPYPCPSLDDPLKICYVEECSDVASFNEGITFTTGTNLPQLPPLLNFCEDAFGPNANNATLLGCAWSPATPFLNIGQQALNVYNQSNGTNYTFAEFPDQNTVTIAPPDLPSGGPPIPEVQGTFRSTSNTDLAYSSLNSGKKLKVAGKKSELSQMSFDLVSLIDFSGYDTSYSLGGGRGSIDVGDIAPTLTIDQNFDFEYDPVVHLQLNLGVPMAYTVHNADNSVDHTGNGQMVDLIAGQYIMAVIPAGQTAAVNASGSSSLDGNFKSLSSQEYFRSLRLTFGEVKMAGVIDFKLINETVLKGKFGEKGILDHTFNLALPNSISLPNFVIDPENPVVDVTYLNAEDIVNIGGGKRQVVYKIGVTNQGDVALSNVQTTLNLATAFAASNGFRVLCMNSGSLNVNTAFNGKSDTNLLAGGNTLAVGETKFIELVLEVTPLLSAVSANGCFGTVNYTIAAKASATSPIGTNIQSDYNQCTMQITAPDISRTINLGASVLSGLQDFTVYGWNGVLFDKPFTRSFGNVGSFTDLRFENSSLNNSPPSVIVGDFHVRNRIILNGNSKVVCDYVQNTGTPIINNSLSALLPTGVVSANSACVVTVPPLMLTKPANGSTQNVNVGSGTTRILNPGSYKDVIVAGNGTLVLRPGVYNIDSWRFSGANARVRYQSNNSPITIHVDKFLPSQQNNLQMTMDGPGKVSDVTIYSYSNQNSRFNNSLVQGVIIAPNSEVEFDLNSRLEGSCYASRVNFKNNSLFKGVKYTLPLNVSGACQTNSLRDSNSNNEGIAGRPEIRESKIILAPNPSSSLVTLSGLDVEKPTMVEVYDVQGRQLRSYRTTESEITLNVEDLAKGMYIITCTGSDASFKFIKN